MSEPPPSELDPQTLARFRNGDISALSAIFELYGSRIYRLARRMMGSAVDAEDATQEIFLRAYEGAAQFEGHSELFTWLYRLAVRHCLNRIKQRRRQERLAMPQPHNPGPSSSPTPLERMIAAEQDQEIDTLLESLPPNYRACILLRDMEGLSYAQIADLLEVPAGTVMSRLSRARGVLRQRLAGGDENHPAGGNIARAAVVQSAEVEG